MVWFSNGRALAMAIAICFKSVQSFRVTCLFTGQYDTGEYGTIAGVILCKVDWNIGLRRCPEKRCPP